MKFAREQNLSRMTRHRPLLPQTKRRPYITTSPSAEPISAVSSSNGSGEEQNSLASLGRGWGSTKKDTQPIIKQVQSSRRVRSNDNSAQLEQASVRRWRGDKGRSLIERLETFRSAKELRNRTLKDKGSWSYDWRVALADLEKHGVDDASNTIALKPSSESVIPRNIRADDIPRPAHWTKASFHKYVYQLTHSNFDRLLARNIYLGERSHTDAVADVLESLFAEHSLKYIISVEACNLALRFFVRYSKIARGRDLFSRLQELQGNIDPSTYNIMLEAAATQKDLFTFTAVLKRMISHGVRPDLYTWFYLALAVQEEEVRLTILKKLAQRTASLTNPVLMRKLAALTMPHIASSHLEPGKDPLSLLNDLDNVLKPEWFSHAACQQIVEKVGIHHSIPQALLVLKGLCDRGYNPTQGILMQLLRQCSWTRSHNLAIEILRLFRMEYAVQPSRQIYDVLFEQAWRGRLYNCCRVLWVHACVKGHTSFTMQEKVKLSLHVARSKGYSSHSRSRLWEETAGKVIAGCGRLYNVDKFWDMMSHWKPAEESFNERDRFLRAARSILDSDMTIVGRLDIPEPLDKLLSEALAADRRWAVGRALKEVPVECKCSQVIDIHLVSEMPMEDADDRAQLPQPSNGTKQLMPVQVTSGHCWMSAEMRSKPCACPEWVKEKVLVPPLVSISGQERSRQG
ncbi:MAG: hypothetical protein Q9197_006510, partial [Variospora fuerteventurae]